jgi:hypothetical protein
MYYNNMYNNGGVHIETVGETRMKMSDESGDVGETSANWDLEYNNDERGRGGVEGEIEATQNGETTRYKLQMDNRDLAQLFSKPHENGMIGERLMSDFAMPRKRRVPQQEVMFIREPQMIDDSLGEIMQLVQRRQQPPKRGRSRHMKFIYNSGPTHRRRHRTRVKSTIKSPARSSVERFTSQSMPIKRTRRQRLKKILPSRKVTSDKHSFRSNIPLTEINA